MKKILLCIFFLAPLTGFAIVKIDSVIYISKIPKNGFLLDKGWKFHAGDNPEWAKPDIDGSGWGAINPATDIYYLPQVRDAEIGWFRLKLHVDTSLINQPLAINISQAGASEIYLNGRLVYRFGVVNKDYSKEKTVQMFSQPFAIKFDTQSTQVITVRYSFNRKNFFINYLSPNPCLKITLNKTNEAFAFHQSDHEGGAFDEIVIITLYSLLSIMSLFLYFSFRIQKAYLYFGVECINETFCNAFILISISLPGLSTSWVSLLHFGTHIFALFAYFNLLRAIYLLCKKQKSITYYILIFYAPVSVLSLLFLHNWSATICFSFFLVMYFEILRVLGIAIRKKIAGTLILFSVFVCVAFLQIVFIYELGANNFSLAYLLATISLVIIPIGLSFFLASEFAKTGQSLQARVIEVEQLSEKTISQEKEKQEILTAQNETLEQQVTERTAELNQSLANLQATQTQLIQSEKMASLGELTAGIAHEIQNPLNFVNNFSEVNREMLAELLEELDKGDIAEAKAIAVDIEQNEEKINHHGNRAAAIVKGMLEHSRTNTGEKQLTDMNMLCDEFLKLSFHGLRAKDKSFNAEMVTHCDPKLPKVNVSQQDMGRVMLNLFNNGFYAVNQKLKTAGPGYKPEVTVSTSTENGAVIIKVKDNGIGVPNAIKEKIMQPFFTTKPTGEGTGLGLSLTYDMVVKGHGGSIQFNSVVGEGSEFIIRLPLNQF